MTTSLSERLNAILPRITDPGFLASEGIGNEIACYIFDYPAEDELVVPASTSLCSALLCSAMRWPVSTRACLSCVGSLSAERLAGFIEVHHQSTDSSAAQKRLQKEHDRLEQQLVKLRAFPRTGGDTPLRDAGPPPSLAA